MSQIEILFHQAKNGLPGVVVDGKLLGYAKRLHFAKSSHGRYLANSSAEEDITLVKVVIEKVKRITGIPHDRDVPVGLRYVIEFEDKPEESST